MTDAPLKISMVRDILGGWGLSYPHERDGTETEYVRADIHAAALEWETALREAVTPSGLWQPPEDREDGYRCLGWTEDGWVCVIWLQMGSDAPRWVTDWYPERDDEPTAFAPLPSALGAKP